MLDGTATNQNARDESSAPYHTTQPTVEVLTTVGYKGQCVGGYDIRGVPV